MADLEIIEQTKTITDVRELYVFKLAFDRSLDIHTATLQFPKIEQYALADQLRRSSKSVCASIAEGFNKQAYSKPEFGRYLAIAAASAGETQIWIEYALRLNYINDSIYTDWDKDYRSIKAMLYKLKSKL